jgi:hypothetical protein
LDPNSSQTQGAFYEWQQGLAAGLPAGEGFEAAAQNLSPRTPTGFKGLNFLEAGLSGPELSLHAVFKVMQQELAELDVRGIPRQALAWQSDGLDAPKLVKNRKPCERLPALSAVRALISATLSGSALAKQMP